MIDINYQAFTSKVCNNEQTMHLSDNTQKQMQRMDENLSLEKIKTASYLRSILVIFTEPSL